MSGITLRVFHPQKILVESLRHKYSAGRPFLVSPKYFAEIACRRWGVVGPHGREIVGGGYGLLINGRREYLESGRAMGIANAGM